jgi:hypothetical protein
VKDQLFLMKPGFTNAGMGPFYCADSVAVEGLLGFFPELREKVDVTYVEFPRPRAPIAGMLGDENQSIPVLVLADGDGETAKIANGHRFIDDEKKIRSYLSAKFGLPEAG